MGRFRKFVEEGLWLNDKLAELGKSKIYPPKKQTKISKAPALKKFNIPPPPKIKLNDK